MESRVRDLSTTELAVVGECCVDLYLTSAPKNAATPLADALTDADFLRPPSLGGISVNVASSAFRCGAPTRLFVPVGSDSHGQWALAQMQRLGMAVACRTLAGETAVQRLTIDASGERRFCGFNPGVMQHYTLLPSEVEAVLKAGSLAVPCSPESAAVFSQCRQAVLEARAMGMATPFCSADFSPDSIPEGLTGILAQLRAESSWLDLAFVGGQQAWLNPIQAMLDTLDRSMMVLLTAGADGAFLLYGGKSRTVEASTLEAIAVERRSPHLQQPSLATLVRDTTGCGDAFQGGFLAGLMLGRSHQEALLWAAQSAAEVAAIVGSSCSENILLPQPTEMTCFGRDPGMRRGEC
jgi:2-dehydro-3-deoxygluconokinase